MDSKLFTEEQINEQILRNLATTKNVPAEFWINLDQNDEEKWKDDDKIHVKGKKKVNDEIFAQSTQINGLVGCF